MKRFLRENTPKAFYRDRSIIDTNHSMDREISRYGNQSKDEIIFVIEKAIDKIIDNFSDDSGVYVIHSRSTGIGLVLEWRPDQYLRDKVNHAFIVTILPRRAYHSKSKSSDVMIITEIKKEIEKRIGKPRLEESKRIGLYDRVKDEELGIDIHLFEGKVYDLSATIIIVD